LSFLGCNAPGFNTMPFVTVATRKLLVKVCRDWSEKFKGEHCWYVPSDKRELVLLTNLHAQGYVHWRIDNYVSREYNKTRTAFRENPLKSSRTHFFRPTDMVHHRVMNEKILPYTKEEAYRNDPLQKSN
jgi:hypothetical protein